MMHKTIAYFLVFLIFVPSLVCAMPVCGDNEEVAMVDAMDAPCPDHLTMIKSEGADIKALMVLADCLEIDLFHANEYSELKSSVSKDSSSSVNDLPLGEFQQFHYYLSDGAARPPPGEKQLSPPTPSIILSTQRLRI